MILRQHLIRMIRFAECKTVFTGVYVNRHLPDHRLRQEVVHRVIRLKRPGDGQRPLAADRPQHMHDFAVARIFELQAVGGKRPGRHPFDEFHVPQMPDHGADRRISHVRVHAADP